MSRCNGHQRHWFGVRGVVGLKTPVCTRCGASNPKKLTDAEFDAIHDYWGGHPVRLGHHNEAFFSMRYGAADE